MTAISIYVILSIESGYVHVQIESPYAAMCVDEHKQFQFRMLHAISRALLDIGTKESWCPVLDEVPNWIWLYFYLYILNFYI